MGLLKIAILPPVPAAASRGMAVADYKSENNIRDVQENR